MQSESQTQTSSKSGPWRKANATPCKDSTLPSFYVYSIPVLFLQMLSSKDVNFVGYTYKNFEIVNDYQVPGMGTHT